MAYTLFSSSDASTQTTGTEIQDLYHLRSWMLAQDFAQTAYDVEEHIYHQYPDESYVTPIQTVEVDDSSTVCTDDDTYEWDDPNAVYLYEWY